LRNKICRPPHRFPERHASANEIFCVHNDWKINRQKSSGKILKKSQLLCKQRLLIRFKIGNMIGKFMAAPHLFDHPADFEPLLPDDRDGRLGSLGLELLRRAERLRGTLHPITQRSVATLARSMNSYYSNLIEGHRTMPRDIDSALAHKFVSDPKRRALQQLHLAHVETQDWMESAVDQMPAPQICSSEFLCQLHREFYERLPVAFRHVEDHKGKSHPVSPGKLRSSEVSVGRHVPPGSKYLPAFLRRFAEFYGPLVKSTPQGFVALAAAHQRLAWIHPFLDGNGRVTRLFTQAWLRKAEADADGLWTLSRGLARKQDDYRAALADADERRRNDFDGRGALTDRGLAAFCEFILRSAIDQLDFMRDLLDLETLSRRVMGFAQREESAGDLPTGSALVLRDLLLRGEISRGEVARIAAVSPRTGQTIARELLARRLALSDSPKGALRWGFPSDAAASYFPNLFPAGAE
jgi:Fic family protein